MTPEQWNKLQALLDHTGDLDAALREASVREQCVNDPELMELALAALNESSNGSAFLKPPALGTLVGPGDEADLAGNHLGEFEILEHVGAGGMGVVYRAKQRTLDREVAVKVLFPSFLKDPKREERFQREARAAAKLDHPGIVRVLTIGRDRGIPFLAMELVRGPDLATEIERLQRRDQSTGPLPAFDSPDYLRAVAELVAQAADALAYAHAHGIVHRDIKPANMLLDAQGRVRVVDFGLARDDDANTVTRSGDRAGTPAYMSPEQISGKSSELDGRTDVYSLGVVLYELLALRRPFVGNSQQVLLQIQRDDPPRLSTLNNRVPRDLELVCMTAIARSRAERYSSAASFENELQRFLRGEAITVKPPSLTRKARSLARRHRFALIAVALAGLGLAIGNELASAKARSRSLTELAIVFERVLAKLDWDQALDQVIDARRRLLALRASGENLPKDLTTIADTLEKRFTKDHADRMARGKTLLRTGMGGEKSTDQFGGYLSPPSERDLAQALLVFERAHAIYYDDDQLRDLSDLRNTFPKVSVRLSPRTLSEAPPGFTAHVSVRAIDPLIGTRGPRIELGTPPIVDVRVAPGNWRITVEIPDYGFSEHTRYLIPRPAAYEIVARVRPMTNVLSGMKAIPAGRFNFDVDRPMACDVAGPIADFEGFLIDEAQVSNREYIEFMQDTGYPCPKRWRDLGYVGDWRALPTGAAASQFLDLPVAGINYLDAQQFAEWTGKRLPTHLELERALRGEAGLHFPWDGLKERDGAGRCNIDGTDARAPTNPKDAFTNYLANVRPVRDEQFRQRPEGLLHGFGNVSGYTESLSAEPHDGLLMTQPWERLYLGAAWDGRLQHSSLASHAITGIGERYTKDHVGIRCCRSGTP